MNAASPTSRAPRFHFVDLLRGWAVLIMIETHVVNALILPEHKLEFPHKILTFINGLVAPTFLFCAGFALAISLKRKWNDFAPSARPYWRYIARLLFILIVGYSLHLPFFSLSKLMALNDPQAWLPFYQADILQTIAVTLLLLALVVGMIRNEKVFYSSALFLWCVAIFAAPVVREADLSAFPVWLQPYLTMQVKSQFPLFPWAAFLIGGLLSGAMFIGASERSESGKFMRTFLAASAGVVAISLIVEALPFTLYPNHDFWKGSPEFFFVRFGIVGMLLYVLWSWEQGRSGGGGSMLALFGQESLIVYVVHLLVVYGYTYEFSFIRLFGPTLEYLPVFGLFLLLSAAMYALAYAWHVMKHRNRKVSRIIQFAVLAGIVIAFVLK